MARIVNLLSRPFPYLDWLTLQEQAVAARKSGQIDDTVYLVEHNPVITIRRSSNADANLLTNRDELDARRIQLYETDRGGDITYHAPGQLVAYPIVDLNNHGRDLHAYIRGLEQSVIDVLEQLGISGRAVPGLTGVWVGEAKIAAIGIKVSRWVTSHGVSLNNTLDLEPMRRDIVPCGLVGKDVTSLKELRIDIEKDTLAEKMATSLAHFLGIPAKIVRSDVHSEIRIYNKLAREAKGST